MLPNLVAAYIEIDRLTTTSVVTCTSAVEAFDYLIKRDSKYIKPGWKEFFFIDIWEKYMDYVQQQERFSPEFTQWDKHTREFDDLAEKALGESRKVIEAHNPPDKRLPEEVVEGIYIRTAALQRWRKNCLNPVRAREDYKEWKEKQVTPVAPRSQCKIRSPLLFEQR